MKHIILTFLVAPFSNQLLAANNLSPSKLAHCEDLLSVARAKQFRSSTILWIRSKNPRLARILENGRIGRSRTAQRVAIEILSGKSVPSQDNKNWYILEAREVIENGETQLLIEIPSIRAKLGMRSGSKPSNLNTFYVEFISGVLQGAVNRILENPDIKKVVIDAQLVTNSSLAFEFRRLGFKDTKVIDWIMKFIYKGSPSKSMKLYLPVEVSD